MAWPLVIAVVASALISAGISYYQSRQTEDAPDRDPLDDGSIPRVTESDPIPVVFGSPILRAPNVVWWKERSLTGSRADIARVQMLMAICHGPIDALLIYLDDMRCTGEGGPVWDLTGGIVHVEEGLFGGGIGTQEPGTNPANGIFALDKGFLLDTYLMPGRPDQVLPAAISTSMDIGDQPSYRGVLTLYGLFHFDAARRNINPISFIPVRTGQRSFGDAQWQPLLAEIGSRQMNPAHIIREILTDKAWGAGEPEALIDDDSFLAAATQLSSEGFGLSVAWAQPSDYTGLLAELERHIDASIYQERTTGKYTLRLVRDDYDVAELPVFGPDEIRSISWTRPAAWQLVNEVKVKYRTYGQASGGRNYIIERERTVAARDSASQLQRGSVADLIDYPFVYTPALAERIASRDLLQLGQPLASVRVELAPSVGRDLRPTDLFIIEDIGRGIPRMVVRVVSQVEQTHEGRDAGVIIEAVEDAFAFSEALSSGGPDIEIGDPPRPDVPEVEALELPFYLSHAFATEGAPYAALADTAARERALVSMVAYGTEPTTQRWDLRTASNNLPARLAEVDLRIAPSIEITFTGSGINYEGGPVEFSTDLDFDLAENEEILVYLPGVSDTFGDFPQIVSIAPSPFTEGQGEMRIGLFDTVTPVNFPLSTSGVVLGAVVWDVEPQIRRLYGVDNRPYPKTTDVTLEAITKIGASRLGQDIPSRVITADLRAQKPIAPGMLRVTAVDDTLKPDGYVQINWRRRDRGAQRRQADNVNDDDILDASRTMEVDIYKTSAGLATFTLLRTVTGLSGTFYRYVNEDELLDNDDEHADALLFVVRSKRGTTDSQWGNTRLYIRL